jgi:PAS domain S-box-containing protein
MKARSSRRRRAEPLPHAQSSRSWQDFRQLVDASRDASIVFAEDGRVLFANAAANQLFQSTGPGAELIPKTAAPSDKTDDVVISGPDGRQRVFERSVTRVTWDDAPAWLVTLRDTTGVREVESHLRRVNRLYAALTQTDAAVSRASGAEQLLDDVCRISVAFGGFRLAWIARPNRENTVIERVAAAGAGIDYLNELHVGLDPETPEGQGPTARTLRLGVPYVCDDFAADVLAKPWHTVAARHGIRSFAVFPVRVGGFVHAVFGVYADETGYFTSDLVALLTQIASEISGALDRLATRDARSRAERALAESEARFRQMAEATRQVFWLRDAATGSPLYISPAFENVFGRSPRDVLEGRVHVRDLIHPDDWERVEEMWQKAKCGQDVPQKYRIVRPDGGVRWIEDEIRAISEHGRIVRLSGCATDITERHEAEEQLRLFRNLVEYSNDGFHIIQPDENFRLVFINEAGVRHFGWSREKLTTLSVWDWDPASPPERCRAVWESIQQTGSVVFETT